jgi:hypothetical protein
VRHPLTLAGPAGAVGPVLIPNLNPASDRFGHIPGLLSHPDAILISDLDRRPWHHGIHDPFRFTAIHHLMIIVSYIRARPWLVVQADLARQS